LDMPKTSINAGARLAAVLVWVAVIALNATPTASQDAADSRQFDDEGPVEDDGSAPADTQAGDGTEGQELTPEEQAQIAEADAKSSQIEELYGQGRYAEAIVLAEEVLAIHRKVLGEEHPETTTCLCTLGDLLHANGDYAAARPYYEQALAIRRRIFGEEHPDTAESLNSLGGLLMSSGDYAGARPYLEQALAIYRRVHGEEHLDTAWSLNSLGLLLKSTGDYAAARSYYEQALAIRRKVLGEEHPNTATSLHNLGALLVAMGDYAAARPCFEQALAIRSKVLGEEHPATASSLNSLGFLLDSMGNYAEARPYYEQALAIRRKVFGEEHADTATALDNLGGVLEAAGDYAAARPYHEQALAIYRRVLGEKHPDTAVSLNNLGYLLQAMGDHDAARPYYEQALAIATMLVEETSIAQNETGQLRMMQSMQSYLDEYVSFLLQAGGGDADAYRATLTWKGATLVRQRATRLVADNEELAPLLADLQAVVRDWSALATAPSHADSRWKDRLGLLAREKERLELELSRRSAAFRAATVEVPIAELQRALPQGAALVDYFEFWFNEPSTDAPGQRDWRRSLAAFVVSSNGEVEMLDLGNVSPIHAAIDQWRVGYGATDEARQAGALLREKLWAPLADAVGDATLVLISPDGALGKLPFAALPGAEPGTYLIEDVALALVPVPRLIPALVGDDDVPELSRDLLALGGVDYDHRADASDDEAAPRTHRPWERRASDPLVQRSIVGEATWPYLQGTESEAAYIAGLYQRIMGLPADSERVVHLRGAGATEEAFRRGAPDCALLHVATHGFFASEDQKSALARDDAPGDLLPSNIYGDRLATVHGYSPGLLSGLVFAGANVPIEIPEDLTQLDALPDDGILTADEIAFLPLSGAQLVVLSACESGLGESAGGEGLLGIQRAFQVAGARTTIATLWKVNDEATRRIMEEFYRNYLEREMSPLEALRAAQLWALDNVEAFRAAGLLDESDARPRLSPQFWAPFVLSGDWR
jgi:CHAT domain-containing protein/tetratricopeptide (TPR) repeat protein